LPTAANLQTFPPADADGVVHLTGTTAEVTFFSGASTGDILQFQIDKNIAFDSDGDGDPANDLNNSESDSLENGTPFTVQFSAAAGEVVAQLTVVDSAGRGSLVQRKIVFDETEVVADEIAQKILDEAAKEKDDAPTMNLISNRNSAPVGETISFAVLPAPENSKFQWDFNGDGEIEAENENAKVAFLFRKAGDFKVKVTVISADGTETELQRKITIEENSQLAADGAQFSPPVADFSHFIEENTAKFENFSLADENLPNRELTYFWDFSDGTNSTEKSPTKIFDRIGEFPVTLEVLDAAEQKAKITKTVRVEKIATEITAEKLNQVAQIAREKAKEQAAEVLKKINDESFLDSISQLLSENKFAKFGTLGTGGFLTLILLFVFVQKLRYPSLSIREIFANLSGGKFDDEFNQFLQNTGAAVESSTTDDSDSAPENSETNSDSNSENENSAK
jgi:PKD repeat protein